MSYPTRSKTKQEPAIEANATFNSLPTEIRLLIWEEFVRIPRIIHIDALNHDKTDHGFTCYFYPPIRSEACNWRRPANSIGRRPAKSEQVCPLLGVNKESRWVALKLPLIHLEFHLPVPLRRQFQEREICHLFAIRSHDILFFENSEYLAMDAFHSLLRVNNVANIMIDLDVRLINYQAAYATPDWTELFVIALSLVVEILPEQESTKCLKNFYCLTRSPTAEAKTRFELDDLRELDPKQFPEHERDLERWLDEFRDSAGP
ncbi:hypothetical protein F4679DRAFT_584692 [Xylaria curta]|nr:hypothetical protein F4679DRAFT_584692 [Xylaria curta]